MMCGVLISLVVGIMMGCASAVRASLKFPIRCLSLIPPTAMIAIYFVLFGTDMKFYVAVIAFGIFPILAQTIYQSVKNDVADDAIYKAYTLGASDMEIVWDVILPQIMPKFLEAIRMTVGPALIFLIAAEWNLADVGIGYRLKIESRMTNMNIVYIYLVILCITSYIMDWSLSFVKEKLCPWYKDEK
jgi:NitT/TauT family transport system permease protein